MAFLLYTNKYKGVVIVTLINGDCLEVMGAMPDNSIDMVLSDLPYGVTNAAWDNVIPFPALWEQYKRVVKPDGAVVLFSVQPFTTKLIHSNLKDYKYNWYWKKNNKTGGQFAKVQPMRCIEDICVFYQKHGTYNPQGIIKLDKPVYHEPRQCDLLAKRVNGSTQTHKNYPVNLLEFKGCGFGAEKRHHPTQKPVELLEYLIKTYTDEGQTVLDNCMGSGSTGVAAINTGRAFIGIELDEGFYNIAKQRVEEAKGV